MSNYDPANEYHSEMVTDACECALSKHLPVNFDDPVAYMKLMFRLIRWVERLIRDPDSQVRCNPRDMEAAAHDLCLFLFQAPDLCHNDLTIADIQGASPAYPDLDGE
ncbi:hypothetical protein [Marinobacter salarius]|uniref:Uncharacterized protein n=1 Tax=Marinobacter salarius TaxID=1420917 RepID=A0A1W6KFE3_9GAMM|nr:hypothetical protein [Marinobacter salarius]ARM86148.1 hypothetical protein MARSALSMR5_04128 [Marinobacter salarius]